MQLDVDLIHQSLEQGQNVEVGEVLVVQHQNNCNKMDFFPQPEEGDYEHFSWDPDLHQEPDPLQQWKKQIGRQPGRMIYVADLEVQAPDTKYRLPAMEANKGRCTWFARYLRDVINSEMVSGGGTGMDLYEANEPLLEAQDVMQHFTEDMIYWVDFEHEWGGKEYDIDKGLMKARLKDCPTCHKLHEWIDSDKNLFRGTEQRIFMRNWARDVDLVHHRWFKDQEVKLRRVKRLQLELEFPGVGFCASTSRVSFSTARSLYAMANAIHDRSPRAR